MLRRFKATANPQLLTLVNPGKPPSKKSKPGGSKVAKRKTPRRNSKGQFVKTAGAKKSAAPKRRRSTKGWKKSAAAAPAKRKTTRRKSSVKKSATSRTQRLMALGAPARPRKTKKASGLVKQWKGRAKKPGRGHRSPGWYKHRSGGRIKNSYLSLYENPPKRRRRKVTKRKSTRRASSLQRDSKGRFLKRGASRRRASSRRRSMRRNPAPRRSYKRRSAKRRSYRRNPMTLIKNFGRDMKKLVKPAIATAAGFYSARIMANWMGTTTFLPVSVQPYAPMLGQVAAAFGIYAAGQFSPMVKQHQVPALVGVGVSILEAVVNRFAPASATAWIGTPDPGLGTDLDVYEAALRGYGMGYVPSQSEIIAAATAADMGEYIATPMGEYIADPLGEYVAEPMGEYVAEPLSGYDRYGNTPIFQGMAGDDEDGVEVYEAMAGAAPAAEGIGEDVDFDELDEELDEISGEVDELEEIATLDLGGLNITALDGVDVDIFDQGMSGPVEQAQAIHGRLRGARRSFLEQKLAPVRKGYKNHVFAPIRGGGIFGDQYVAGQMRLGPQETQNLKKAVAAALPTCAHKGEPVAAQETYAKVKQMMGVQSGNAGFKAEFAKAYQGVKSGQAVISDPAYGAPMNVTPIAPAAAPKQIPMIQDQFAGNVGGLFQGTVFNKVGSR